MSIQQSISPQSILPSKPFQLRLIMGVPILKEDSQIFNDLSIIFSRFLHGSHDFDEIIGERYNFWSLIVLGISPVLKQLEDSALEENSLNADFAIVLLDFSWLNSELGHHLAHLCSSSPHTSLLAISPPGKLDQLICQPGQSSLKISCLAIRPLLAPVSEQMMPLLKFMTICSSLTGKPLPLDLSSDGIIPPSDPILPTLVPQPKNQFAQSPRMSAVNKTSPKSSASILVQKTLDTSKSNLPRPSVRHVPADDWLTYSLNHAKLYKCGAEIAKELEEHSLYIHDVADVWALYPRQFQQLDVGHPEPKRIRLKRRKKEPNYLADEQYKETQKQKQVKGQRNRRKQQNNKRYNIENQRHASPRSFPPRMI